MIGKSLSHYDILESIGAGGMGAVYRARDTRLGRDVAIKVLPDHLSGDEERLARFKREATLLASLNHPNVATLYGLEVSNGTLFLVMELVEGEDLATRIGRGALPLRDVVSIAKQVAAGLDAAHQQGIIHRDLKPGNVRLTADGTVKVLDFGLAKSFAEESPEADLSQSPTVMASGRTLEGVILGTAAYMSPEQARGQPLDRRTDVWSFGCVIYECLSGDIAFKGETVTDTLAKILEREPDWTLLPLDTPAGLRRILECCLEKDAQRRWRDIADVGLMIEQALNEPSTPPDGGTTTSGGRTRLWMATTAAFAILAAATFFIRGSAPPASSPSAAGPVMSFKQLTLQGGRERYPQLSPDGSFLVYEGGPAGHRDIFLQRVGGHKPINLTESPSDDATPAYSPDGEHIAFRSSRQGGGIFIMGSTGESMRRLTDFGAHPAWSPDGTQLVIATEAFATPLGRTTQSELWIVDVDDGSTSRLSGGDAVQPSWLPNGHRIAYWRIDDATGGQRDIWTIRSDASDAKAITEDAAVDWNPKWSPDGRYLYYASDRNGSMNIWRVRVDEESGVTLSDPEPLTAPSESVDAFSLSRDGAKIVFGAESYSSAIERMEFNADLGTLSAAVPVVRGSLIKLEPEVSPDGRWVAFRTGGVQEDILIARTDGGEVRKLTDDTHRDRGPSWSPDSKSVLFYSDRGARYEVWSISIDGSKLTQITETPGRPLWFPTWSFDGRRIIAINETGTTILEPQTLPVNPKESIKVPAPEDGTQFRAYAWSPDGTRLAGEVVRAPNTALPGVVVYSLESNAFKTFDVANSGFGSVCWLADNRRLLAAAGGIFYLIDTNTGAIETPAGREPTTLGSISITADNTEAYVLDSTVETDVWLATIESTPVKPVARQQPNLSPTSGDR